ncbi:uncharacterized protein LOC128269204 [Anopheles cruzii]|uniref:uncharacterized protein LOC128269204 n=1 Tax=Anopheles cruzii TaxID=68878 RepID=UPI0022EC4998|nr:uncharacterized protein LOC128269204 [Anopheles cruzii]
MEERFLAEEVKPPGITVFELNSSNPSSVEKMPVENSSTPEPSAMPKVSFVNVERAITVEEGREGKGFELNSSNTSTVKKSAIEHPSTANQLSTMNASVDEATLESSIAIATAKKTDKASSSAIREHQDPNTIYEGQGRRLVVLLTDLRYTMPGENFVMVDLPGNATVPAENYEEAKLRRSRRMKIRKQVDLQRNKGQKKGKKN